MAASDNLSNFKYPEMDDQLTFRESREWLVETLEPPGYIGQACGRPEVLLLQAQFFTDWERRERHGRET